MTPSIHSPRVAALLERTRRSHGRLIFALDATASREPTWDLASQLTSAMFEEAAKIGGLGVELTWYRGPNECSHSSWTADAHELVEQMARIRCAAGATQIKRVLQHIRSESEREKVDAVIFIGDAVEEPPRELYAAAVGCPPLFIFQEGDVDARVMLANQSGAFSMHIDVQAETVESVFRELARLTGGAYARFDAGAAAKLKELLQAVVAFAVGGVKALGDLRTEGARKLLNQMK